MTILEKKIQELENRLTAYEKSGFWSRRDVIKTLGAGLLGLGALSQSGSAGSFLADMNASNPQVKINDIALVKTTAGQTINVSTEAELTAALAALAAAPSLLGNVIIQLAAGTYTGNFTIPAYICNGFTVSIYGSSMTQLKAPIIPTTVSGRVITKVGAWTGLTLAGKLVSENNGTYYQIIESNTGDTLTLSANVLGTAAVTYEVLDWSTIIDSTGVTITTNLINNLLFYNLKITSTTIYSIMAINSIVSIYRCWINNDNGVAVLGSGGTINIYSSYLSGVIDNVGNAGIVRVITCKSQLWYCYVYNNTSTGNAFRGERLSSLVSYYSGYKCGTTKTSSIGISLTGLCYVYLYAANGQSFLTNCYIGLDAILGATVENGTLCTFTSCTSNYSPIGAHDAAYIS
jgi:hypothetical protein